MLLGRYVAGCSVALWKATSCPGFSVSCPQDGYRGPHLVPPQWPVVVKLFLGRQPEHWQFRPAGPSAMWEVGEAGQRGGPLGEERAVGTR